jgi:tRNA-2-methylthio-N6-dimethylallyladenosine synthase
VDELQERIVGEINAQLLGQTVEVLVEERQRGKWRGRTRTNKLVFFDVDDRDWTGQLAQVRLTRTGPWSMQGTVQEAEGERQETRNKEHDNTGKEQERT